MVPKNLVLQIGLLTTLVKYEISIGGLEENHINLL